MRRRLMSDTTKVMGKCPVCGGDVVDISHLTFFGCSNWRKEDGSCKFKINKVIAQRPLTPSEVRMLLEDKRTPVLSGFLARDGREFSTALELDNGFKVRFSKRNGR